MVSGPIDESAMNMPLLGRLPDMTCAGAGAGVGAVSFSVLHPSSRERERETPVPRRVDGHLQYSYRLHGCRGVCVVHMEHAACGACRMVLQYTVAQQLHCRLWC